MKESVDIYNYTLKLDTVVEQNRIKGLIQKAIIETGHADVDENDRKILTLPYSVKSYYSHEEFCEHDKQAKYYKPDKIRPKETEKLSFVKQEDHPAGLLCKPCPVCVDTVMERNGNLRWFQKMFCSGCMTCRNLLLYQNIFTK